MKLFNFTTRCKEEATKEERTNIKHIRIDVMIGDKIYLLNLSDLLMVTNQHPNF